MPCNKAMYTSLKKKLDDAVNAVTAENETLSSLNDKRKHPSISAIIKDIERAIQERRTINADLERIAEESRVHFRKGALLVDKKCHQLALKQFSKSLCCIPYNLHKKAKSLDDENGIVFCCEKVAKHISVESCRSVIMESLAARAEMLRTLGQHELALRDIEEALSFRPGKDLRSAILQTHKLCLSEMRMFKASSNSDRIADVAHLAHSFVSNASDLIKVSFSENKGRYLEANEDIKAGDVLISERPYASVLLPEFYHSHCYHCIKPFIAPIPCFTCQDVFYCSKQCQEASYSSYHCIECEIWPLIQVVDSFAHLSLRTLLTAEPEELLGALEKEKHAKSATYNQIHGVADAEYKHDYKAIYNLVTNSDLQSTMSIKSNTLVSSIISSFLMDPKCLAPTEPTEDFMKNRKKNRVGLRLSNSSPALLDSNLNSLVDAFTRSSSKENRNRNAPTADELRRRVSIDLDEVHNKRSRRRSCSERETHCLSMFYKTMLCEDQIRLLLMRHLQQISCNVHMVTTLNVVEEDDSDVMPIEQLQCKQQYSLRKEQRQIALALYPTACLMNHACDPDVIVSFMDDRLVVRATHNISPGEEITHCYVPHVGKMMRAARQKMLQRRYFFICGCSACKRDEERERRQLCSLKVFCPTCRDFLSIDYVDDSYIGTCCSKDCGQTSNIEAQLHEIENSRELFLDAVDLFKQGNIKRSLATLQKVSKIRCAVLMPKDPLIGEVHEAISRCYEVLREWDFASYYCSLSLDSIEQQYGPNSSECANAVSKLAHFLFNGKLFNKAGNVVDRAIRLSSLHYGHEGQAVKVLLNMKECMQNVLNPVSQFAI